MQALAGTASAGTRRSRAGAPSRHPLGPLLPSQCTCATPRPDIPTPHKQPNTHRRTLAAGRDPDVSYSVTEGSLVRRIFPAFSALGSITLLFGDPVLLETQSTLAAAPSAVAPMRRAMFVGYTIIFALVLTVNVTGYWAFGSGVASLVFNSIAHPTWLVILGNLMLVGNGLSGYLVRRKKGEERGEGRQGFLYLRAAGGRAANVGLPWCVPGGGVLAADGGGSQGKPGKARDGQGGG